MPTKAMTKPMSKPKLGKAEAREYLRIVKGWSVGRPPGPRSRRPKRARQWPRARAAQESQEEERKRGGGRGKCIRTHFPGRGRERTKQNRTEQDRAPGNNPGPERKPGEREHKPYKSGRSAEQKTNKKLKKTSLRKRPMQVRR